jgi:hypothetical protein
MAERLVVSPEEIAEGLQWVEDWRAGLFTPAYLGGPWPVEMHGLVDDYERLAHAYSALVAEREAA